METVILVNTADEPIGRMEKLAAHERGLLHRAFSVFLFNERGETLLQQRAASKYHSPLLWTNSCCSHQREGETNLQAARRRLHEELGIAPSQLTELYDSFSFIYRAEFDNGLTEHELDHVLLGRFDGSVTLNTDEVAEVRWISMAELAREMDAHPEQFTAWFQIIFREYQSHLPQ
ncbi:MAG: isopentenyl-diphosphate Delta-isomerase [Bacteroidetes bacterium]|nr:isopentenyl-diphosphate Delta-isomerase [Bacteroidota bacterium]